MVSQKAIFLEQAKGADICWGEEGSDVFDHPPRPSANTGDTLSPAPVCEVGEEPCFLLERSSRMSDGHLFAVMGLHTGRVERLHFFLKHFDCWC